MVGWAEFRRWGYKLGKVSTGMGKGECEKRFQSVRSDGKFSSPMLLQARCLLHFPNKIFGNSHILH